MFVVSAELITQYFRQNLIGSFRFVLTFSLLSYDDPSQFEDLISSTIEDTKDIPEIISETGKVGMPHKGKLLVLRLFGPSPFFAAPFVCPFCPFYVINRVSLRLRHR